MFGHGQGPRSIALEVRNSRSDNRTLARPEGSEFVGEHRQEFILTGVGLLEGFFDRFRSMAWRIKRFSN